MGRSIRARDPVIDLVAAALPERASDGFLPDGPIVRMDQRLSLLERGQALDRDTEQARAGWRDRDAAGRDIQHPGTDARLIEDVPEFFRAQGT